jgi:Transketolase, N-terminal subunit
MSNESLNLANEIRRTALKMVHRANASHIGGAFSMTDILAVMYSEILRLDPAAPKWPERDRFLLSKGHACSAHYAVLGLKGFFDLSELDGYASNGSRFISHTSYHIPGVEFSAGSLGHALPVACGLAVAGKRRQQNWRVYCLVSDGELDEGSNWEAILFAPQQQLDNLILIVDYNKIQSLGFVKDVIDLEPLAEKFTSFGWSVIEINGHDHAEIFESLSTSPEPGKPTVIIAHTVKGKGVDFMENKLLWHYKSPDASQLQEALGQIC